MLNRPFPKLSRRQFNALAGAAGVSLAMPRLALAQGAPDSAAIIHGKKCGLIIHNAKLGVMETPLSELRKYAHHAEGNPVQPLPLSA